MVIRGITEPSNRLLLNFLLLGTVTGIVGIATYSFHWYSNRIQIFSIVLLVAIASLVTGFFTGTLFGMPRRNNLEDSDYALNNSLVEISEWLTKIIVGLGLVHLKQLPTQLEKLGVFISQSVILNPNSLKVFSVSVIVYFVLFGLLLGYNTMRLILSSYYKEADDRVLMKLKESQEQVKNLLNIVNADQDPEVEKSFESGAEQGNQTQNTEVLKAKAQEKLMMGLRKRKDDPQKGQWGEKNERNNRIISAEVKERFIGIYSIMLRIASTDQQNHPLIEGEWVLFALHPTFGSPPIRMVKVVNQKAEISLLSYGSFTVGAFVDGGKTELELDLAELPNVSESFRER